MNGLPRLTTTRILVFGAFLFTLLGVAMALTDFLNRAELGRDPYPPGALVFTFPLFLAFGMGAVILAGLAFLHRRALPKVLVGFAFAPLAVMVAFIVWVIVVLTRSSSP